MTDIYKDNLPEKDMELDFDKLEQVSGSSLLPVSKPMVTPKNSEPYSKPRGNQLHARNAVNTIRSSVDLLGLPSRCCNRPGKPFDESLLR